MCDSLRLLFFFFLSLVRLAWRLRDVAGSRCTDRSGLWRPSVEKRLRVRWFVPTGF
jgi:hypothetical protein